MPVPCRLTFGAVAVLLLSGYTSPLHAQRMPRRALEPFASESALVHFLARPRANASQEVAMTAPAPCDAPVLLTQDSSARGRSITTVAGRVTDTQGKPLLGTLVQFRGAHGWPETLTDSLGRFELSLRPESLTVARTLDLFVRRIGNRSFRRTLSIARGDRVSATIALCTETVALSGVVVTGAPSGAADAVTNVQTAGVDEGGIVKRRGDVLVILRRGRLFTIDISRGGLRGIHAVDAFGPDVDPSYAWYDELLVSDSTVVVIGYSYARGGTEVGLFRLAADGRLSYRDTYQLSGGDYYSSRNYAARLIGSELILYTPARLWGGVGAISSFPSWRRWRASGATAGDTARFERIVPATRIYRAAVAEDEVSPGDDLHTVVRCDIRTTPLTCQTTAVMGGPGHVFHVSATAVYVAAVGPSRGDASITVLYRLPLDGGDPTAVRLRGSPLDQFSFLETERDLHLMLRRSGYGTGMWASERGSDALALVTVPLAELSDGGTAVPPERYLPLPWPSSFGALHQRFVGTSLLYGVAEFSGMRPGELGDSVYVVSLDQRRVRALAIPHTVERIEVMGPQAVVMGGADGDLHFTGITLGARPRVQQRYVLEGASQSEFRSHGFFYHAEGSVGARGVIGLPILAGGGSAWWRGQGRPPGVFFLRNSGGEFSPMGGLFASPMATDSDDCRASCYDWYGNARPLFLDDRVVALLGYELVEGDLRRWEIKERQRTSFLPKPTRTR